MDRLNMSLDEVIKSRRQANSKPKRLPPRNKMQTMQNKRNKRIPQKLNVLSKKIGKLRIPSRLKSLPQKSLYRQKRELRQRPIQRQQKIIYRQAPIRANPGKKILNVSGLQPNLTNQELFELFSKIGPLKRCNVNYDQLGQSKMTAIIGFEEANDARRAIQEYNGAELDEKKLRVQYAERMDKRQLIVRKQPVYYTGGMQPQRQQRQFQQQGSMRTFRQKKMRRQQQQF